MGSALMQIVYYMYVEPFKMKMNCLAPLCREPIRRQRK